MIENLAYTRQGGVERFALQIENTFFFRVSTHQVWAETVPYFESIPANSSTIWWAKTLHWGETLQELDFFAL